MKSKGQWVRRLTRLGVAMVLAMLSVHVASAAQAPFCGGTITRDTKLFVDLPGCPGNGIIIGRNNITLNLNRHTISGQGAGAGVLINGHTGVTVKNGTVQQFGDGVRLEGGATGNFLMDLILSGNSVNGILLLSSHDNLVKDNDASDNGSRGILLDQGSRINNRVIHNMAHRNGIDGITLGNGSNRNHVRDNTANGNGITGIVLFAVKNTVVKDNTTNDNHSGGIFVFSNSTSTTLTNNQAFRNATDGIGVEATDSATKLTRNISNDNGDLGIDAPSTVKDGGGNRASGNGNPLQCTGVICLP